LPATSRRHRSRGDRFNGSRNPHGAAHRLAGALSIPFDEESGLLFHRDVMVPPGAQTQHPNGLRLTAFDPTGRVVEQRTFFSIAVDSLPRTVRPAAMERRVRRTSGWQPFRFPFIAPRSYWPQLKPTSSPSASLC